MPCLHSAVTAARRAAGHNGVASVTTPLPPSGQAPRTGGEDGRSDAPLAILQPCVSLQSSRSGPSGSKAAGARTLRLPPLSSRLPSRRWLESTRSLHADRSSGCRLFIYYHFTCWPRALTGGPCGDEWRAVVALHCVAVVRCMPRARSTSRANSCQIPGHVPDFVAQAHPLRALLLAERLRVAVGAVRPARHVSAAREGRDPKLLPM